MEKGEERENGKGKGRRRRQQIKTPNKQIQTNEHTQPNKKTNNTNPKITKKTKDQKEKKKKIETHRKRKKENKKEEEKKEEVAGSALTLFALFVSRHPVDFLPIPISSLSLYFQWHLQEFWEKINSANHIGV